MSRTNNRNDTRTVFNLYHTIGNETFCFRWFADEHAAVHRQFAAYAASQEKWLENFSWYDAACCSAMVRRVSEINNAAA